MVCGLLIAPIVHDAYASRTLPDCSVPFHRHPLPSPRAIGVRYHPTAIVAGGGVGTFNSGGNRRLRGRKAPTGHDEAAAGDGRAFGQLIWLQGSELTGRSDTS